MSTTVVRASRRSSINGCSYQCPSESLALWTLRANSRARPAWRGRGLAKALLLHSFREFHQRGKRRVGLGVDSQNATGATRLYEGIGMVVDSEQVVWEKEVA